jgi:diguanylate cyclase (GGDEF)-like protein
LRLSGSVLIAGGMLLFHLPLASPAALISHLLLLLGLMLCALAMYRNTYADLQELVASHETRLRRLDANLQNEVVRRVASIEKSNRVLLEKARTDSLTGLFSKAAIVQHAEGHMDRHPREQLSLIMLDIDHFKGINDKLGHPVGDQCLKSLAGIARASFRGNDILGRYGGDEFIFLLPGTPPKMALTVAERFRRNIEVGSNPKFTVSIGVSTYPQDGRTVREIIDAADQALYRSKERGRNQVNHLSAEETLP